LKSPSLHYKNGALNAVTVRIRSLKHRMFVMFSSREKIHPNLIERRIDFCY